MPSLVPSAFRVWLSPALLAVGATAAASAQGINPALKELAAAANKEGSLTLSWSGSTFAGIQGAARYQAAINKMFGTNIRVNFLPGPDMARIANQLATEFTANQRAHVDLAARRLAADHAAGQDRFLRARRLEAVSAEPDHRPDDRARRPHHPDRHRPVGRDLQFAARADEADARSPISCGRNGRARSPRRPTPPASTCSTPTDVWGKERTVEYVTKLSAQITGLIRCGEAERIATGEYLALVMDCTGQDALQWQEKGAPVGQMMPLDAAQQRYYYFAIPKNAQHPNAAKLYTVFQMTEEGQRLSYETWKTDLHFLPGSRMGKMVDGYLKQNVPFKEVTVEWQLQHPEINAGRSELIKILTTKK